MKNIFDIYYGEKIVSTINLNEYNKNKISLGRAKENDIVINSNIVSRVHAFIELKNGSCFFSDNNSTNGIMVNNKLVDACELKSGDSIKIDSDVEHHEEAIIIVYSLVKKENEQKFKNYYIKNNSSVKLGRNEDNDIVLNHISISRNHAEIYLENGDFYIKDLKSTNGTYLNGTPVEKPLKLTEGDRIFIGNTKLLFYRDKLIYNVITNGLSLDAIKISKTINEKKSLFKPKMQKRLLDDITISVKPGELVSLIGSSGAGKSTFLDALSGLRPATDGCVLVNNTDFYSNYGAYKSIIGYVPQQDIVYDNLTVQEMLTYAAKLRMPKDVSKQEIDERVKQVIKDVELYEKENVVIKNLSGGQKKRTSIAVELLADPQLFFLDEPSSGLDPGMERNLMNLLRKLADKGKTIILITHAMDNLNICDKVIFLGRGGKLCFFGNPLDSLDFFGVSDFVEIYDLITDKPEKCCEKFKSSNYYIYSKPLEKKMPDKKNPPKVKGQSGWTQFCVLSRRYLKLTLSDMQRFIILLGQAPVVAILLGIVTNKNAFSIYENTSQVLFTLSCSAVWIGLLNSIQEICKERNIFKRERTVNLKLLPYICSKLVILSVICMVQSILMIFVFNMFIPFPTDYHLIWNLKFELIITTFLTLLAATSMGITISTLVTNTDRAMSIAPFFLIPQIIFSGFIFKLSGFSEKLSHFIIAKWSLRAMAVSLKINELPLKIVEDNKDNAQMYNVLKQINRNLESAYNHDVILLYKDWRILILISIVCIIISFLFLKVNENKQ